MGSKTTTTYAQSTIPAWYTNYAQQILSNQNAVSQRPYQAYQGPRIAGFSPDQQTGFDMTKAAATSAQPGMETAMGATANALGRSGYRAAAPYLGAATQSFAPAMNAAMQGTVDAGNRSSFAAAAPYLQQASDQSFLPAAYGALGTAGNMAMASTNPTGLAMAQPYLNAAGQSSVANINDYMNPYIDSVVNRYGELGARTLSEQLAPAISNKYISSGQLMGGGAGDAPSGMVTDSARALRDVSDSVNAQTANLLSSGYNTALGAAQGDLSRYAQLGQTAGQLGQNQQNIMANAGQQFGQLGSQYANIGQAQQGINTNLANTTANIYGQDTANQLAASGQLGQQAGTAGNFYANLGTQAGNLYNTDTSNQLAAAGQLGGQAGQYQTQNLAGAQAVTGVGAQEQAQTQANLDLAYQNFLQQQGYPQAQIDQMVKTFSGLAPGVPQGQVSVSSEKAPDPSVLNQVLGGAAILGGSGLLGGNSSGTTTAAAAGLLK